MAGPVSPHRCPPTLPRRSSSRCPGVSGAEEEEHRHLRRTSESGHTAESGEGNAPLGEHPRHLWNGGRIHMREEHTRASIYLYERTSSYMYIIIIYMYMYIVQVYKLRAS